MSVLRNPLVLLVLGLATASHAADQRGDTNVIRVRPAASASPAAARHLRQRIADAALEACGAGPGSLAEAKASVASSQCWKDSYAGGIAQVATGQPIIAALPSSATDPER